MSNKALVYETASSFYEMDEDGKYEPNKKDVERQVTERRAAVCDYYPNNYGREFEQVPIFPLFAKLPENPTKEEYLSAIRKIRHMLVRQFEIDAIMYADKHDIEIRAWEEDFSLDTKLTQEDIDSSQIVTRKGVMTVKEAREDKEVEEK